MAESEANINNQSLVTTNQTNGEDRSTTTDFRGQAQQYGQQAVDALNRAKGYAQEYGQQAVDKFKDLQGKDLNQIAEDAKDFARRKPVQAIAISAAVGLALG
jgi:ElaB/YqjD/DUF883 family membrane-anchored ribosome-binding protein